MTRVAEIWRFPVKSLQGERLERAAVGPRGIVGDRKWGIADESTGYVLTARREPKLLYASARLHDDNNTGDVDRDALEIVLPDGAVAHSDDDLSDWLGRAVTLRRAGTGRPGTYEIAIDFENEDTSEWISWNGPSGTFHDSTRRQVTLLGASTVGQWDRRRFRANIVTDGGDEDSWVGHQIRVGDVILDVTNQVDRCVITTRPQPGGIERDLDVLRTINRERAGNIAVGGMVRVPGELAVGDQIELDEKLSSGDPKT
jgi:uncharacterized protein YcbX